MTCSPPGRGGIPKQDAAYDEDAVPLEPLRIFMFTDNVAAIDGDIPHGH